MNNKNLYLKDLTIHLMNKGDFQLNLANDMLDIEGCATVTIEKIEGEKVISLSFEVRAAPTLTAVITKTIIDYCKNMKVEIFEPYAFVEDEEGMIIDVIFGEEATTYFHHRMMGGSITIIPMQPDNKEIKEDSDKKVDELLDQISARGINSLNKKQKEFLTNHSKGKK